MESLFSYPTFNAFILIISMVLSLADCNKKEDAKSEPTHKENTMSIMKDSVKQEVKKDLSQLSSPVKLLVFTQDMECALCTENRALMQEVASLSSRLSVDIYDFKADTNQVKQYAIDKIQAVAVCGSKDVGIRFYGVPGGYEFGSLLHAIKVVSNGHPVCHQRPKRNSRD
jgi:alkyl hydroperoxide reductase subunit AhpF